MKKQIVCLFLGLCVQAMYADETPLLFSVRAPVRPEALLAKPASITLRLRNVDTEHPLNGELHITPPGGIKLAAENISLALAPGEIRMLSDDLAEGRLELGAAYIFKATLKSDKRVREMPFSLDLTKYAWCEKVERPLNIDGESSDWKRLKPLTIDKPRQVVAPMVAEEDEMTEQEKQERAARIRKCKANGYVGWDEENLYVLVEVVDDVVSNRNAKGSYWLGDSVEIYLDMREEDELGQPRYGADTYQLVFNAALNDKNTPCDSAKAGGLKSLENVIRRKENGYVFECRVPMSNFACSRMYAGRPIGFNFAVNEGDLPGKRDCQIMWMQAGDGSYKDASKFGRLILRSDPE